MPLFRRAHRPRGAGAATLLPLLLLLSSAGVAPAAAATAPQEPTPTLINVIATHSGKCLEAENSSLQAGAPILQTDCTGQLGARWTVQESPAGGGAQHVVNAHSGLCLALENTSNITGTAVRQADCASSPGANFRFVDRGTHVWLQAPGAPRKCLGVTAGSHTSGTAVRLTDCYDQVGTRFTQRQAQTGNAPAEDPPPPAVVVERLNVAPDGSETPRLDEVAPSMRVPHSISADGRFVAFQSHVPGLAPGDTNNTTDVFVRDRYTSVTHRVSVSTSGVQGNGASQRPSVSEDGRYVSFESDASNLVAGDTNGQTDVFVHDRETGATQRVSVSTSGAQQSMSSDEAVISANGRFVAFVSQGFTLVSGDTNLKGDVFVRDRQTGTTERVSVGRNKAQSNGTAYSPSISADGRHVAFTNDGTNLVTGDTNNTTDVFVRDRQSAATERVSLTTSGTQPSDMSHEPVISGDGRHVAFTAMASLSPSDANSQWDVYTRDRQTGTTQYVSGPPGAAQADGWSYEPSISADGGLVAFQSAASNLVSGDSNGALDVFRWDRQTGVSERVSTAAGGAQGNLDSYRPVISGDGRFLAYRSDASALVPGDANQAVDLFVRYLVSDVL